MIFQFTDPNYSDLLEVLIPVLISTIIGFIISIVVAVFISKDAKRRGMDSTIYVILVCCCCGWLIGGIIYLISASSHPRETDDFQQPSFNDNQGRGYGQQQTTYDQPQYQQPRQSAQPKPAYRDTSTTMPSINTTYCSICGSTNQKGAKFCSTCGANLN